MRQIMLRTYILFSLSQLNRFAEASDPNTRYLKRFFRENKHLTSLNLKWLTDVDPTHKIKYCGIFGKGNYNLRRISLHFYM
mgnify:CR=1 FL=1